MKYDSIWFGNFSSFEEVYNYIGVSTDEFGDDYWQFKEDFKISEYEDDSIMQVYYEDKTNDAKQLLLGNPGDYQYINQLKSHELLKKYNTVIIYSGYNYQHERDKTGLKYKFNVHSEDYDVDYIGTFTFDYREAKRKYPQTLSKYGDEQYQIKKQISLEKKKGDS